MLNLLTDEESFSAPNYLEMGVRGLLSEPGVTDFADGHGLFFYFKMNSTCSCLINMLKIFIKNVDHTLNDSPSYNN